MSNPLKAYRGKHGLSQSDLAVKLGVSRQLVGALETGTRPFTPEMANLIEEKLGINRVVIRPDIFRRRAA